MSVAQFSVISDVSFVYVKHDINSSFKTFKKNKNSTITSFLSSDDYTSVYKADVDLWRKKIGISGSKQLLVAFVWCHDNEFRMTKMFPEFLPCDVTFGVDKKQRNLFLVVGVDGSDNYSLLPIVLCHRNRCGHIPGHWMSRFVIC